MHSSAWIEYGGPACMPRSHHTISPRSRSGEPQMHLSSRRLHPTTWFFVILECIALSTAIDHRTVGFGERERTGFQETLWGRCGIEIHRGWSATPRPIVHLTSAPPQITQSRPYAEALGHKAVRVNSCRCGILCELVHTDAEMVCAKV